MSRYLAGRSSKERKVVERVISVGDPVYVLGTAQLPADSIEVYVGPDRVDDDPFLVTVGSERDALFSEQFATLVTGAAAAVAAASAGVAWVDGAAIQHGGFDWATLDPAGPIVAVGALSLMMGVASLVFVRNGLVRLHQRARAAWGLIDVQLRRRHELILDLARVVAAHAAHETQVQASVAQLRSTLRPSCPTCPATTQCGVRMRRFAPRSAHSTGCWPWSSPTRP